LGLILGDRNLRDYNHREKETAQNHLSQGLILPPAGNRTTSWDAQTE
jgi:hypothetical protein